MITFKPSPKIAIIFIIRSSRDFITTSFQKIILRIRNFMLASHRKGAKNDQIPSRWSVLRNYYSNLQIVKDYVTLFDLKRIGSALLMNSDCWVSGVWLNAKVRGTLVFIPDCVLSASRKNTPIAEVIKISRNKTEHTYQNYRIHYSLPTQSSDRDQSFKKL